MDYKPEYVKTALDFMGSVGKQLTPKTPTPKSKKVSTMPDMGGMGVMPPVMTFDKFRNSPQGHDLMKRIMGSIRA